MLSRCAQGFGAVALTALAGESLLGDVPGQPGVLDMGHIPARARSVIFLYMDGAPSQVDTFDPKPALSKWDGKPFPAPDGAYPVQTPWATLSSHRGSSSSTVNVVTPSAICFQMLPSTPMKCWWFIR